MRRVAPYVFIWSIGSTLAFLAALLVLPASHLDGTFLPVGNDSFYHARRILDAIPDLTQFYQFDPRIHAPEGSLIVWPWGYDFLMAVLARAGLSVGLANDPMSILAFIPPCAVLVSIALILGITRRMGVSLTGCLIVVLCFAASPLTQILHGVGNLDHHYAEFIVWLASLWALLRWLSPGASRSAAVLAGAILGIGPMFHSDLFIPQIPLVAALLWANVRGRDTRLRHAATFAATLVLVTLAAAAPSLPLREGRFEFFDLSWFQVYAAAATATLCVWLSSSVIRPRLATLAIVLVLALPGLTQLGVAGKFVAGDLAFLGNIDEAFSPFAMALRPGGFWRVSSYYSLVIWLAPVILLGCLVEIWRESVLERSYFWIANAAGLVLLLSQFRFHYFGSLGLFLPLLIWSERAAARLGERARYATLLLGLVLVLAYIPALTRQLLVPPPPAGDFEYGLTRRIYPTFAAACRAKPGIALATANDGHYVRYHTDCSVIANNFIVTQQHIDKLREVRELMRLTPRELVSRHREIRYVFVRLRSMFRRDGRHATSAPLAQVAAANPVLVRELVLTPLDRLPPQFHLLRELKFAGPEGHPYARLFEIDSGP